MNSDGYCHCLIVVASDQIDKISCYDKMFGPRSYDCCYSSFKIEVYMVLHTPKSVTIAPLASSHVSSHNRKFQICDPMAYDSK